MTGNPAGSNEGRSTLQYQRRSEVVEAIQAKNITGIPDGSWLVNSPGSTTTTVLTNEDFTRHFEPVAPTMGARRLNTTRMAKRETLTVPTAHHRLNPRAKSISDKVLSAIGTTPMNAAAIADVAGIPSKKLGQVRTVLSRLAKSGAVHTKKGTGLYAAAGGR